MGIPLSYNAIVSTDQTGASHRPESVGNITGLSEAPAEIVWLIAEQVETYTDYVAFASICRSFWLSLIPRRIENEVDYYKTVWEWRLEADLHCRLSQEWQQDAKRPKRNRKPASYWQRKLPQPCFNTAMADPKCLFETIRGMLDMYEERWPAALAGESKVDFECPLRRAIVVGRLDVFDLLLEKGFPIQGKSQHGGGSKNAGSPLALTVESISKMHTYNLRESQLPLMLDRILSQLVFRADKGALVVVSRAIKSANVRGGMALVIQDLVSRGLPEQAGNNKTMEKVRLFSSLAVSWRIHRPSVSEDGPHRRLREYFESIEQPQPLEEDNYYHEFRRMFQVEETQEEEVWLQPYIASTIAQDRIHILELIDQTLDQLVSGEHSSGQHLTPLPGAPAATLASVDVNAHIYMNN
ncbi:hypothetical protein PG995_013637 [Apiospora arundinis]